MCKNHEEIIFFGRKNLATSTSRITSETCIIRLFNIMKNIKVLPCMNSYYGNKNCIKYFKVIKKSIPVKLTSIRHLHVLPAVVVSFSCCCAPYRRGSRFCVGGDGFLPPTDSRVCRAPLPSCPAPVTGSAVSYKHTDKYTSRFSNVCCYKMNP